MTEIFVFGSNLAGIHGAGSAKAALLYHGAIHGIGVGLQGNSYAIPTKDERLKTLPLSKIKLYVDQFVQYSIENPTKTFKIVAIGCGLAGYKPEDIAPMFSKCLLNCHLPKEFQEIIRQIKKKQL